MRGITINAVGIIAEYNPFHNGHLWHLTQAKQLSGCNHTIAVISGNFTQRGEPACFNKWIRAEMAVKNGVDLVLELPTVFAVRSAEYFATAGIRLLNRLGLVSHLAFGTETNDLSSLQTAAKHSINSNQLRAMLKSGMPYSAAIAACLSTLNLEPGLISQPNNILAIEYLRAIQRFAPSIIPVAIPRRIAQHHDPKITATIASATAIRAALQIGDHESSELALPHHSKIIIKHQLSNHAGPVTYEAFATLLLYKLRTIPLKKLQMVAGMNEGLQYAFINAANQATSIEHLITLVKSKRYTRTRLQRMLIYILLDLKAETFEQFDTLEPLYARVLAFNDHGRLILKRLTQSITVINKTAQFLSTKNYHYPNQSYLQQMLAIDTLSSDIYALGMPNTALRSGATDFQRSPFYHKS